MCRAGNCVFPTTQVSALLSPFCAPSEFAGDVNSPFLSYNMYVRTTPYPKLFNSKSKTLTQPGCSVESCAPSLLCARSQSAVDVSSGAAAHDSFSPRKDATASTGVRSMPGPASMERLPATPRPKEKLRSSRRILSKYGCLSIPNAEAWADCSMCFPTRLPRKVNPEVYSWGSNEKCRTLSLAVTVLAFACPQIPTR